MIDLAVVVAELAWIVPEPVYVGGAVVPWFLDAFGRSQMRPTEDVDCIVPRAVTRMDWWDLEEELRNRGWSSDPSGPSCRYRSPAGAIVDLMPAKPEILGFSGRWYPQSVALAERLELPGGQSLLVPPPALLFACKLEAYGDRGASDPWMSKDLEDLAALLDGCGRLLADTRGQDADLRAFIAERVTQIEASAASREALRAQLPRGGDAERQLARVDALIRDLRRA